MPACHCRQTRRCPPRGNPGRSTPPAFQTPHDLCSFSIARVAGGYRSLRLIPRQMTEVNLPTTRARTFQRVKVAHDVVPVVLDIARGAPHVCQLAAPWLPAASQAAVATVGKENGASCLIQFVMPATGVEKGRNGGRIWIGCIKSGRPLLPCRPPTPRTAS